MAIFERGETYVHRINYWDTTKAPKNPSTVSFTLYDPCNYPLVSNQAMTNDATGSYYYNYLISSSATYGRYTVQVKATSPSGLIEYSKAEFFIMPWDVIPEIRDTLGAPEQKSVTDDVIARTMWSSYGFTLHDLYTHVYAEAPNGNVATGIGFDGTNTSFQTKQHPVADINGDGAVTGTDIGVPGVNLCLQDITGWWIDSVGQRHPLRIVAGDSLNGIIALYQEGTATAIPSTQQGVYLDYWIQPQQYNQDLFRSCVVRLVCYELSKRLQSLDEISLADIRNNNPIITLDPSMYYKEYKRYLGIIRGPMSGGVE